MKKLQFNVKNKTEKLLQDNYGLIVTQAIYFKPKNNSVLEEFIQVGVLAFLKAAENFDENRGKFSTYICQCVHNAIYDFIKKNKKQVYTELEDIVAYQEEDNVLEYLPDNLSNTEIAIIKLKLENYSKKEIGDIMKMSQNEISNAFKQIKIKIKTANED